MLNLIYHSFLLCISLLFYLSAQFVLVLYTHIINMLKYTYTYICWIHTDAMNNRRAKTSLKNIPLNLFERFERVLLWQAVGDWTKTVIYWLPLLWPSALCLSRSPDAQPVARGPSSLLSAGLLYHILSLTHLISNSIGVPDGPFGRAWLSLPHLVSNASDLQLSDFLSWPSYIIVPRSLNLWNGMFDSRQAEITVMQFRGHSLPVHQFMSVSWAFTLSHFVSQIRLRDFFRLLATGMCHFLPVYHFGMACLAGSKVKIQHSSVILLLHPTTKEIFRTIT